MADCSWNPLSWGGCAENAGGAAWNGVTTAGNDIAAGASSVSDTVVNEWNNDPKFRTMVISVAVIAVVAIATGGLGLAVAPVLIGGLSGAGISGVFYGATCGGSKDGCSPEGFGAAMLSGGALGALGGIAAPVMGATAIESLGLSGVEATAFTHLASGGISAAGQLGVDIAGGKGATQTGADALIAFGFGAALGTEDPMAGTDMYSTTSLAREFSRDATLPNPLETSLDFTAISTFLTSYVVPSIPGP
jgi:hypothetical protein